MPIAPEYLHLVHKGPFPCYLYGRNSVDPKKRGRSVGDQLQEGGGLAGRFGWPVEGVFTDTGISATRHAKKRRDDFEEMIDGIRAGKVRIVVAYEASRYYRDLEVYVRLRKVCHESNTLLCYNGTIYDLSNSEDRNATAQHALQAETEGDKIRDRNLRTARLNAERGRPHGPVPDGYRRRYDPDTGELVDQIPSEIRGPIIESFFLRAYAGESIVSIVSDCAKRGILTQHGLAITRHYVRRVLKSRTYTGQRVHLGTSSTDAVWPALVSDEVFFGVQAILDAPGRQTSPGGKPAHLLGGIMLCGLHPELMPLGAEPACQPFTNRTVPSMRCSIMNHATVNRIRATAFVEEAVLRYLSSAAAVRAFEPKDTGDVTEAARGRLARLQAQLDEAREAASTFGADGAPLLRIDTLASLESRLIPMIKEAKEAATPSVEAPELLRSLLGRPDVGAVWETLSLDQQRLILRLVVTPRLHRASVAGVRVIEPGRITLAFKGQPGFMGDTPRGRAPVPQPAGPDAGGPGLEAR
ncbi:recombinase family protein [Streptomyces sp. NPDC002812]|uniref:recombinase family protein n=1 Tax=Streptomyces sp. NPDC002812 TaxID=3154434 RepID=UPI003327AD1B